MCLAIPVQIVEMDEMRQGRVEAMGLSQTASFALVPQAQVGDWVLLHAGFAIEVIDEESAQETLALIEQMPELIDQQDAALGDGAFARGAGSSAANQDGEA